MLTGALCSPSSRRSLQTRPAQPVEERPIQTVFPAPELNATEDRFVNGLHATAWKETKLNQVRVHCERMAQKHNQEVSPEEIQAAVDRHDHHYTSETKNSWELQRIRAERGKNTRVRHKDTHSGG